MGRLLVLALVLAALQPAGAAARPYDFDGDGRQDLAVGWDSWDGQDGFDRGAVLVLNGSADGVSFDEQLVEGPQVEHQNFFGQALASADFDGDGHRDLAVGSVEGITIVRGSERGLGDSRYDLDVRVNGEAHGGRVLAAGDMNRDGFGDLAVGAGLVHRRGGSVLIYLGGRSGLRYAHSVSRRVPDFGAAIALGHVNGDRYLDLVEAYEGEDEPVIDEPNDPRPHASYCPGTRRGPRDCLRMRGSARSLTVADVTGDGFADVIQGDPYERAAIAEDTEEPGILRIWRGSRRGPRGPAVEVGAGNPHVPVVPNDRFATSIDAGHVNGDRFADIVVGQPWYEDEAGMVAVLRGGRRGIARRGHLVLRQDPAYPARYTHGHHYFGEAVALLDITGDGRKDLVVGAPAPEGPVCDCTEGSISVFPAEERGLFASPATQTFDLRDLGIPGDQGINDFPIGRIFGRAASSR
jgi:hypothetical protein